jgi:hypothetical protein
LNSFFRIISVRKFLKIILFDSVLIWKIKKNKLNKKHSL